MENNYSYLSDKNFLLNLDKVKYKVLYAKIILLTWEENPIKQIESKITTGSITIDGTSSLQRSCSLTMPVPFDFAINEYENHLNKKLSIEVGIKNTISNKYPEIVWFPQGIFVLTGFSSSISNSGYTINIQAKDKMCLLNGDIGGSLTANYTFDSKQDYVIVDNPKEENLKLYFIQNDDGSFSNANEFDPLRYQYYTYETQVKYKIIDIIKNIVHEIGKEPYHNILIEDIDNYGLDLIQYNGEVPLYFYYDNNTGQFSPGVLVNDSLVQDIGLNLSDITLYSKSYLQIQNDSLNKINDIIYLIQKDILLLYDYPTLFNFKDFNSDLQKIKNFYIETIQKNTSIITTYTDTKSFSLINLVNLKNNQINLITHSNELTEKLNEVLKVLNSLAENENDKQWITVLENIINNIEILLSIKISINELLDKINERLDDLHGDILPTNFKFNYFNSLLTNNYDIIIKDNKSYSITKIDKGNLLGYRLTDLIYPGKDGCLTGQVGASITSILDKIKNTLGDFEYFYDLNGRFVFRKTKLYINNDWNQIINTEIEPFIEANNLISSISYSFEDLSLITQLNQTPQINNLKNDFSIWGKYKTINDTSLPLHLRYAIDDKPYIYVNYVNQSNQNYCYINIDKINNSLSLAENAILLLNDTNYYKKSSNSILYNGIEFVIKATDWRELIYQMANDYFNYHHLEDFLYQINKYNKNYCINGITGYEQYYSDLEGFWRELYDLDYKNQAQQKIDIFLNENPNLDFSKEHEELLITILNSSDLRSKYDTTQIDNFKNEYAKIMDLRELQQDLNKFTEEGWNTLLYTDPTRVPFWFDFLDTIGTKKYSIKYLGDRQITSNKDSITAIYYPDTPNILLYDPIKYPNAPIDYQYYSAYSVFKLGQDILNEDLIISSTRIDAFDELDSVLYKNLYCSEGLNITCVPIFYLKPNIRVYVHNDNIKLDGIYGLTKITVPLTYNGTMQLTTTKINTNTFMSKGG